MRLLIDFGAIKTGGGAQLAINFISFMKSYPADVEKIYLLLPEQGPLRHQVDESLYDGTLIYPNSYWKRKAFETTTFRKYVSKNKVNVIYTFFGTGIPLPEGIRSIVSVAYPIICYPDSRFWSFIPAAASIRVKVMSVLRRRRIRRADKVIAETAVMAERLSKYAGIEPRRIVISAPSPSAFIADKPFVPKVNNGCPKILLLSGLDRHKNIWRLPEIARELKKICQSEFVFTISSTRENFLETYPALKRDMEQLDEHFEFLGLIPSREIQAVYDGSDFLMNISDLESFSNNYMEAWKSGLPLICSDTDFARHICDGSAIYIDPHNPKTAAQVIASFLCDIALQRRLTSSGKELLSSLPSIEKKFHQTMEIIRSAGLPVSGHGL